MNEIVQDPAGETTERPMTSVLAEAPSSGIVIGAMRCSASGTGNLDKALAAAQADFQPLDRNRTVRVTMRGGGDYEFKYATFDHIVHNHRPILGRHGLALTQAIAQHPRGGLVLMTRLAHGESGEWTMEVLPLPDIGGEPQKFGSAVTYLKRYAYCAKLNIAAEDDDDGNSASGNSVQTVEDRSHGPLGALTTRAKAARNTKDGTELLQAWQRAATETEAVRGKPEWEALVRHVGVGLSNSLGQTSSSAFVRAARMAGPDDATAFEAAWGGEWAHTLMVMQEEAPETYRALQGHVVAQMRRVRGSAPAQVAQKPEPAKEQQSEQRPSAPQRPPLKPQVPLQRPALDESMPGGAGQAPKQEEGDRDQPPVDKVLRLVSRPGSPEEEIRAVDDKPLDVVWKQRFKACLETCKTAKAVAAWVDENRSLIDEAEEFIPNAVVEMRTFHNRYLKDLPRG